jgi:NADPH-dependent 2,4-dienoyl-CoA reductase/sulfur reductase-like enzyme
VHIGLYETYQYVIPPAAVPRAVHTRLGKALKDNLTTAKVMLGHRINDPHVAERVLAEQSADVILMGRPLIADPEFCNKVIEDRPEDIRKCIACNIGCAGYIVAGRPATCTVNPRVGKEAELKVEPASAFKSVMIAGAGVGGLEAALVASQRGHTVSLYERTDHIGGWAAIGCIPPHKHEIKDLIEYYERQLGKQGITVNYGVAVDPGLIQDENPDVVVVATGSVPLMPPIPGIDACHVHSFLDILTGKVEVGDTVVVIGGGQTGLETAEYLAEMGKSVTVIEMQAEVGADMELFTRVMTMPRLEKLGIKLVPGATVTNIGADEVHCGDEHFAADTVVLAVGQKSNDRLYGEVADAAPEVYMIGDCVAPRRLLDAIHEGFAIGGAI